MVGSLTSVLPRESPERGARPVRAALDLHRHRGLQRRRHAADQPPLRQLRQGAEHAAGPRREPRPDGRQLSATRAARTTSSSAPTSASSAPTASSRAIATATSRSRPTRRSTRRISRPIRRSTSWRSLDPTVDLPNDLYSFFAQDQWRLRTNLTLNLGVRYDRETGFSKITDVPDDSNNFQPRLGFVWDPLERRPDGGARRLRPLRRSELPEHPAQRRLGQGAVEIVIVNPGYPDPIHEAPPRRRRRASPRSRRSRARRKRGPSASASSARSSPGFALSVDGVYCARLQPVRMARSQLSGSGHRGASRPTMGRIIEYADYGNSWYSRAARRRRRPA